MYLLEYISDLDLRKTVQAATCKSEEFNQFANWLFFANRGVIASNLKGEQSKIVKYNHLLANISILYNVNEMTKVFNRLKFEGFEIDEEDMAGFSPYRTEHLGRLGSFNLDMQRSVEPMNHELHI
jgi:TnpA family transposase